MSDFLASQSSPPYPLPDYPLPDYPLPDYPRAPVSDLSATACRLLEYRDFTAVGALLDQLQYADRHTDVASIRHVLAQLATGNNSWPTVRDEILSLLFF